MAGAITRTGSFGIAGASSGAKAPAGAAGGPVAVPEPSSDGPSTVMGNKWQQAGIFAIDGRGTVVWAEKALRADDLMNMEAAIQALGV